MPTSCRNVNFQHTGMFSWCNEKNGKSHSLDTVIKVTCVALSFLLGVATALSTGTPDDPFALLTGVLFGTAVCWGLGRTFKAFKMNGGTGGSFRPNSHNHYPNQTNTVYIVDPQSAPPPPPPTPYYYSSSSSSSYPQNSVHPISPNGGGIPYSNNNECTGWLGSSYGNNTTFVPPTRPTQPPSVHAKIRVNGGELPHPNNTRVTGPSRSPYDTNNNMTFVPPTLSSQQPSVMSTAFSTLANGVVNFFAAPSAVPSQQPPFHEDNQHRTNVTGRNGCSFSRDGLSRISVNKTN